MERGHRICLKLYRLCACLSSGRAACDAMQELADNGMSAEDERDRMEFEREEESDA